MPIRPQQRRLYPIDWPQLSAMIRFERAKGRCEQCRRPHGKLVYHLGNGQWWDEEIETWRNGAGCVLRSLTAVAPSAEDPAVRITRVFLAAAHLDHDPSHNDPRNLKAFCQRCHMLHDREEHRRRRSMTLRMRKALGDLFLGPYTAWS